LLQQLVAPFEFGALKPIDPDRYPTKMIALDENSTNRDSGFGRHADAEADADAEVCGSESTTAQFI
jgi:hypothetical protein